MPRTRNSPEHLRRQPARELWALAKGIKTPALDLDSQRYLLHTQGLSAVEIASRENVRLATVEKSLEKMRLERERYSQSSLEHVSRRTAIEILPTAQAAILAALTATKEQIQHIPLDPDAEDAGEQSATYVQVADHATRLLAITKLTELIESVKQQVPMVNISNQNLQQNAIYAPGQVTTESLIRQIREEKGLALPIDTEQQDEEAPLPDTIDFELEKDLAKAREMEEMEAGGAEGESDAPEG